MKKKRKMPMTPAMLEVSRELLLERVELLEAETEDYLKSANQLQVKNAELKQQLEHYRRDLLRSQEQAAKWEARFDRLLRVAAHEPMATTIVTHSQT